MSVRVGILDSGFPGPARARRGFAPAAFGGVRAVDDPRPQVDHGALVAALIRERGPASLELLDAQIFDAELRCAPEVAAAGLDWLVESGAAVVNTSWGQVGENPALRRAVDRALEAGVWILAATPVRGEAPCPARYPGVVSVSGDARCREEEISDFEGPPADFGASPRASSEATAPPGRGAPRGGSSFACARVCAGFARVLSEDPKRDPREALRAAVHHRGKQTRPA